MDTPNPSSQHLALALHRATALLDRVADGYLRPAHGIGISAFAALVAIDAVEPASQHRIAEAMDVSRAAVTQRLRDLAARGLVEVTADPADARANLVSLSADGRTLLAGAWRGLASLDDGIEDGVDLVVMHTALERFSANAEAYLRRAGGGR